MTGLIQNVRAIGDIIVRCNTCSEIIFMQPDAALHTWNTSAGNKVINYTRNIVRAYRGRHFCETCLPAPQPPVLESRGRDPVFTPVTFTFEE